VSKLLVESSEANINLQVSAASFTLQQDICQADKIWRNEIARAEFHFSHNESTEVFCHLKKDGSLSGNVSLLCGNTFFPYA
jgi:hypothetical protein